MKIAITATGSTPDSAVDQRFGRAYWFLIHDEADGSWEALDNSEARNALQGAGIKAAQAVADRGAGVLLTGVTGPKAYRALNAAGIAIYHGATGSAEKTLSDWRAGHLQQAGAEDASGRP